MRDVLVPATPDPRLPPAGSRVRVLEGRAMGTSWTVKYAAPQEVPGLQAALQRELDQIVSQMSHWEPESLLSQYNRAAPGSWHALPHQFFEVADYALRLAADTKGAYDPCTGALVSLWGFGPSGRYHERGFAAPDGGAVLSLLAHRAAQPVRLDREARCLLQPGGVQLDFSSVAKGYAVDRLAWCLEQHGLRHYLAEAGGELRGAGLKPDAQPWWVELEGVPGQSGHTAVAALQSMAVATSGDYRQFFEHGGQRLSHTLDPRSGYPVAQGVASVTVIHASCMQADALSTALTVLGPAEGLAYADERGIAARFLVRASNCLREERSRAWSALLQ